MNHTNRTKYTAYLLGLISVCSSFSKVGAMEFNSQKAQQTCNGSNLNNNSKGKGKIIEQWTTKIGPRETHRSLPASYNIWMHPTGSSRFIKKPLITEYYNSSHEFECRLYENGHLIIKAKSPESKLGNIFIGKDHIKPLVKSVSFEGGITSIDSVSMHWIMTEEDESSIYYSENPYSCKHYEDRSAFADCENLTSIEIPESVKKIGNSAFRNCTSLKSIELPNSVRTIGNGAFFNCISLISIKIPESVEKIGNGAFSDCISLISINFEGEKVKEIGREVFEGCIGLTSIKIPKSIKQIGENVFGGCTSLSNISIPYGIELVNGIDPDNNNTLFPWSFRPLDCSYDGMMGSNNKVIGIINNKNDLIDHLGLKYNCINFLI